VGLAATGRDAELLAAQATSSGALAVAISGNEHEAEVRQVLQASGWTGEVLVGPDAATELASRTCDVVLNGITGAAGLLPSLAALGAGNTLALANKESLVIGGPLVKAAAGPGQIVPVDSEHSALAQCLRGGAPDEVARLVLTASGGPFRGWDADALESVTPQQALAHPTWSMGPTITINSATLINKGLELIEAHLLFDIPLDRIDVVVHPQSLVHSMVEFTDGSVLAQVSPPDMRLPIALGLAWPHRIRGAIGAIDFSQATSWTFEPVDESVFGALRLAREAGTAGGTAPAVLNAANEEAVAAFLAGKLSFPDITGTVAAVLAEHSLVSDPTLEDVLAADEWARTSARRNAGVAE
jgi:1-deoxy-D-xylulose-5-phosphate reductoisomerase